ncbi:50S ribosomal protein L11 methyltransferase [Thauera linaloolentis]|uniref:Ribosomal protein L11 methyltransferase n=1 Tax=Thauera linaloolentis (strain DSM 12138 / JCM 21573 / CCUG 41526 / CIP 105981 / IAM 15112 / NBRC 102519 / 47Lol) TaxID=1123367 RepID=N6XVF7_THAL4|nr:50S ribosomal protein L11 methyltransferase [Thauera linaloolentis]ENO85756.1 ribosomal protein L11 methyltransferase [Thauera linaloolentis 47Lol = DSM 12138]MCM8564196.1 50S ribosomal protein L11 methyltransferase [Thauera linaloolentis]
MWISVTLQADAAKAEALSDALMDAGALSVSIEDADAGTDAETPQFGEPGHLPAALWDRSRVIALVDGGTGSEALAALLAEAARAAGFGAIPPHSTEEIAEQNWVQLTQSQFDPIRITERLWIVPSWHEAPDPAAINIELDPGMAFGTGSHPTTRLCLEWLCDAVTPGCSLLDYGCGSGILAIAAARLGAGDVLGIDIDDKAVDAARDNAARNAAAIRLQHSGVPLGDTFDLVVANILTNPLCVLAPAIAARVAPGGRVALSGVLETQAGQVIEAWAPFIALQVGATHEGWVRLEGQRPAA